MSFSIDAHTHTQWHRCTNRRAGQSVLQSRYKRIMKNNPISGHGFSDIIEKGITGNTLNKIFRNGFIYRWGCCVRFLLVCSFSEEEQNGRAMIVISNRKKMEFFLDFSVKTFTSDAREMYESNIKYLKSS